MGFALPNHSKSRYYFLKSSPVIAIGGFILTSFTLFELNDLLFLFLFSILIGLIVYIMLFFVINKSVIFRTNYQVSSLCEKEKYDKSFRLLDKRSNYGLGNNVKINLQATKAMVFLKKGDYKKSEEILDKLLKDHPNFITALYYKACLESLRGNISDSKETLKRISEIYDRIIETNSSSLANNIYNKKKKRFLEKINKDNDLPSITDY